jgi:hypothetical protein
MKVQGRALMFTEVRDCILQTETVWGENVKRHWNSICPTRHCGKKEVYETCTYYKKEKGI